MRRLFVPLSTEPFTWFKKGQKQWEVRRYGRQYTEKNVYCNRIVEFRKGYINGEDSHWGIIDNVMIFENINELFKEIPFGRIIPTAIDEAEAKKYISSILSIDNDSAYRLIAFKVNIIDDINKIEISDKYLADILSAKKTTTIRRGIRFAKLGAGILYSGDEFFKINIDTIRYCRYSDLTHSDALADGFNSVEELQEALSQFYSNLSQDDQMTLISFTYEGG